MGGCPSPHPAGMALGTRGLGALRAPAGGLSAGHRLPLPGRPREGRSGEARAPRTPRNPRAHHLHVGAGRKDPAWTHLPTPHCWLQPLRATVRLSWGLAGHRSGPPALPHRGTPKALGVQRVCCSQGFLIHHPRAAPPVCPNATVPDADVSPLTPTHSLEAGVLATGGPSGWGAASRLSRGTGRQKPHSVPC